ncbi:MAG: hypothetical protein AAF416_04575 [Pseudomonadota bacterium]
MEALRARTTVQTLAAGLEELAMIGTYFDDALITTRNSGALISGRGGYAAVQRARSPWRLSPGRVAIRIAPTSAATLARSDMDRDTRLPGSLVALDPDGAVFHRVQYVSASDRRVAEALEAGEPEMGTRDDAERGNVVHLAQVRSARACWEAMTSGDHMDALLVDAGRSRRRIMPYLGANRAWRVSAAPLPSFLAYLVERRIGLTRVVLGCGLLQAATGPIGRVAHGDGQLIASSDSGIFAVSSDRIDCIWVVTTRDGWQLELYDAEARALAVLMPDPMANRSQWNEMLCSLPRTP